MCRLNRNGRSISRTLALLTLCVCGCQSPKHEVARKEAAERWSNVRAQVKTQLATQQFERGLFADAAVSAAEAVGLDPKDAGAYVVLAKSNLELGKPASAERALNAAAERSIVSADLHYLRGVVLELRNEIAEALVKYEKASQLDERNVDYLLGRAECLIALDRRDEALELLDSNAEKFDNSAPVYALAGHVCELASDWEEAAARYRHALSLHPAAPLISERLGFVLTHLGRFREAIAMLQPLLDVESVNQAYVRRVLAECHLAEGQPQLAKSVLLNPAAGKDEASLTLLAEAAIVTDDFMTAGQAIAALRKNSRDKVKADLMYAALLWRRGEHPTAATILYELIDAQPDNASAYCLLATVLAEQNQAAAAADCVERANQLNPLQACGR